MRAQFATTTTKLLDEDPRLALVLADISTNLFTEAERRHSERVVNVGIREQLMVGVAAGYALSGMRPIIHTYAPFLIERPFEQLKLDLGHQSLGAILVSVGASYDWTQGGRTHHCPGDVALLDTLDGFSVHVPGHKDEVPSLLTAAAGGEGRVYIRLSTRSNSTAQVVEPGRLKVMRQGRQGTVVAVGPMLDSVLSAVGDFDVTVLYGVTIRPFDAATLVATLGRPRVALVEPYHAGTSTLQVSRALDEVPHQVLGLGVSRREVRRYGTPEEHDQHHGLSVEGLRRSLGGFFGRGRQ